MLKTPSGSPASCKSSPSRTAVRGVRSEGFRMYVFPAAIATGSVHRGTMHGKLKGVMAATTPRG